MEIALAAAVEKDDYTPIKRLIAVVKKPFTEAEDPYMSPPANGGVGYKTFCGT